MEGRKKSNSAVILLVPVLLRKWRSHQIHNHAFVHPDKSQHHLLPENIITCIVIISLEATCSTLKHNRVTNSSCHVTYLSDGGNHVANRLFSICIHNCEGLTKITKYLTESQKIKMKLWCIWLQIYTTPHALLRNNHWTAQCIAQGVHDTWQVPLWLAMLTIMLWARLPGLHNNFKFSN